MRQANGRSAVDLVRCSPEQWLAEGGRHIPMGHAEQLLNIWRRSDRPRQPHGVEPITGEPGTTFQRWAEINRAAFV